MAKNPPSQGSLFALMLAAGLLGFAFRSFGYWFDGGDYSVFDILRGGPPEFNLRSIAAVFFYGLAMSCLGLMLGLWGLMRRGQNRSNLASGQFRRYGGIMLLATLLTLGSLLGAVFICIWQFTASVR
ncbi:MAG: hypothetical protein AB7S78_00930 [Candidatus Omnitrophota bacterium]